ncbi:hypothetical protein B0H19DRAFT_1135672 [Mycena capillaripes]|nr:hypothetical protein B0H19DRAFT_1135672 [Mycena capillaripes]
MDNEPVEPNSRSKWLPIAVLAGGTVLIAAPLVYLWRVGKPQRVSLNTATAPPPRRVGSLATSGSVSSSATSRLAFPASELKETVPPPPTVQDVDWDDADWGVPPPPPDPDDKFNAAIYTFKAFGAATLIVSSIAFAGIWGLRRYFDVDNMEDFSAQMRLTVMDKMPLLASRMRNALGQPKSATDSTPEAHSRLEQRWSWDDAQERLSAAFNKGGLGAWAEAAAREVEEEAKIEMEKREQLRTTGSSKT